jgi:phosphohistidine phosphatase
VDIYLIRHAEAAPLGGVGAASDAERPLTEAGQQQARQVGAALQRRGVRPVAILTSPLVRARQTADLLASQMSPPPPVRLCPELTPGTKRRKLARALAGLGEGPVLLVGHEPDLGVWAGWLLGSKKVHLDLPKAGIAHLRCSGLPRKGAGTLIWFVPPDWLTATET